MKSLLILGLAVIMFSNTGKAQSCTLTNPSNIVIRSDSGQEGTIVIFPEASTLGIGDCGTINYSPASGSFFRIGSHTVIATTSFGQKCFFTVTVTDNEAPVLSVLTLSSNKILPATNKMKKIGVYYIATDNAQEVNTVLSISSNDENALSSGNKDWEILNNHLVKLKTSSLANGDPRIYTITVSCSDAAGNISRRATHISVSKNAAAYAVN